MTEIRHISDREMALERKNARLVDKTERQSATIHVQAVAIQAMKADAERYQFMKRHSRSELYNLGFNLEWFEVTPDFEEMLDAAMKESK